MALDPILDAIRGEGAAAIAELRRTTAEQVDAILQDGERAAQRRGAEARQAAFEPATAEARQIVEAARAEALRATAAAGDVMLQALMTQISACLQEVRDAPDYAQIWQRLTREALRALGDEESAGATLVVDPRDLDLTGPFARRGLQILPELGGPGGVMVRSRDGRIVVDNTLAARLERALPAVRLAVAALIDDCI